MPLKPQKKAPAASSEPVAEKRAQVRTRETLLQQLSEGPTPDVRCWAARDLRVHPDAVLDLTRALGSESNRAVREAILSSLLSIGGKDVARELASFLQSEDASLRSAVIEALSDLPQEMAAMVERLLSDEDSDVRLFAVDVLRGLPHPRTAEWLIEVVEREPHLNVVVEALEALGVVGTRALVPRLEGCRGRFEGDVYFGFAISTALSRMQERS